MTYEEIFDKVKKEIETADTKDLTGHLAVEVDIIGEGAGAFYIELKDDIVHAEPYEYYDRDCKLILTGEDFLRIMDGSLNAVKAFTVGKLKVEGDLGKALEFAKIAESVQAAKPDKKQPKKRASKKNA